jgi:hypothetical protein
MHILIHVWTFTPINIRTYITLMNISEKLSQFDFKIHEVGHQEPIIIDGDVVFH